MGLWDGIQDNVVELGLDNLSVGLWDGIKDNVVELGLENL